MLKLGVYSSSNKWARIPKDYFYYFSRQLELYYTAEFIKDLNKCIIEQEGESKDKLEEV